MYFIGAQILEPQLLKVTKNLGGVHKKNNIKEGIA